MPRLRRWWNPLPTHSALGIDGNLCVALFMTDLSQVNDMRPLIYVANTNMPTKWRGADRTNAYAYIRHPNPSEYLNARIRQIKALMSTPLRIEMEYMPFDPHYWMSAAKKKRKKSASGIRTPRGVIIFTLTQRHFPFGFLTSLKEVLNLYDTIRCCWWPQNIKKL